MGIKRRRKSRSSLIFLLVLLLTGISIGYASLSDSLKIVGTANANGNFSIEFVSGKIVDSKGINVVDSTVKISESKDTLIIDIKDMQYPGSGATISCVIKNTGTVPAKLKSVTFDGNEDSDISITFPKNLKEGQSLGVNETYIIKFVVKWNIESTISTKKAINFTATLNYEQDVEEYKSRI